MIGTPDPESRLRYAGWTRTLTFSALNEIKTLNGGDAGAGEPKGARRDRAEAQRSGRSLSAQAEAILLEAALERSRGERKARALAYLITQAGKVMEAAARNEGAEFDLQTSRFDVEALGAAIMRLLERIGPPGAAEPSRYAQYPTPADLGRTAAETVLAIATLDKARAHELAAYRNAPIGSPFYGLPQVAEDLGLG